LVQKRIIYWIFQECRRRWKKERGVKKNGIELLIDGGGGSEVYNGTITG
jgi:hypothetical protein